MTPQHVQVAQLLTTTAVVTLAAHALGYLFAKLRQPAVIGEIVAGLLVGPTLLGLVALQLSGIVSGDRTHVGCARHAGPVRAAVADVRHWRRDATSPRRARAADGRHDRHCRVDPAVRLWSAVRPASRLPPLLWSIELTDHFHADIRHCCRRDLHSGDLADHAGPRPAPHAVRAAAGTFRSTGEESSISDSSWQAWGTLRQFSLAFFIPIYFFTVGLKLDLIHNFEVRFFLCFFVLSCGLKASSIWFGAKLAGQPSGRAWDLAVGLNARGGLPERA
jgi:hypothetical protein